MAACDYASRLTENVLEPEIDQVSEALTMCRVGHMRDLATVLVFWRVVRDVLTANRLPFVDDDYASILAIVRLHGDRIGGELGKRFAAARQTTPS